MRTPRAARGLTLIELAVVVAILALLAALAVPSFAGHLEARRIDGVVAALALDLREARAQALRTQRGVRVGVHAVAGGSCYVVHTGAADACTCDAAGATRCTDGATALKSVALPAGEHVALGSRVRSIRFEPLHGTATPAGTLTVSAASGRAVHLVVNITGRVRTCTPALGAPAVPGHPAC